ncbi:9717_t:CDS:2, partial [Entrophospora sp. SA101]
LRLCHYGKYEYVDDSAKICIDEIHNLKEGGQVISSIKFSEYTSVRGICKFVKIIFKKDNDLMIIKRSENLQELYKLYLMKISGNTITHDSTYNIHNWEIDYLCMKLRQLYNEIHLTYLSSRTSLEVDKTDNKIIDKIIENNVKKLEPPLTPNNKPKENTLIILEGNK